MEEKDKINTIYDFYNFIENIERMGDLIWFHSDGKVDYRPHNHPADDYFISSAEHRFTGGDFDNVINLILSKNDLLMLEEMRLTDTNYIFGEVERIINEHVYRSMLMKIYKYNNKVSAIQLLLRYRLANTEIYKKYTDFRNLF